MITNSLLNQHRFHLSLTDSDSNAPKNLKSKNDNTLKKIMAIFQLRKTILCNI